MSDFLDNMATLSAERARQVVVASTPPPPVVPLQLGSFDVIAEIKDHSPAEGVLASGVRNRVSQALQYAAGGAAAISVLTEPTRFAGSLEHLEEVVAAVPDIPVMRKDFLVETIQIDEARAAGASGVLLIATMLEDARLMKMLDRAFDHGMFVLLEAFSEEDLARTAAVLRRPMYEALAQRNQFVVGVNTRDLRTLKVDTQRLEHLAPSLPTARCVAESGLQTADDAATVAQLGYHLALVGSALMRSADPAALVSEMRIAGSASIAA